jgi:hypothetical protein
MEQTVSLLLFDNNDAILFTNMVHVPLQRVLVLEKRMDSRDFISVARSEDPKNEGQELFLPWSSRNSFSFIFSTLFWTPHHAFSCAVANFLSTVLVLTFELATESTDDQSSRLAEAESRLEYRRRPLDAVFLEISNDEDLELKRSPYSWRRLCTLPVAPQSLYNDTARSKCS